jgi:hypothetical protein
LYKAVYEASATDSFDPVRFARGASVTQPSCPAAIATAVALASVAYVVAYAHANPDFVSDFDQLWAGAARPVGRKGSVSRRRSTRVVSLEMAAVLPGTSLVLLAPLGLLPVVAARAVFTAVSQGCSRSRSPEMDTAGCSCC